MHPRSSRGAHTLPGEYYTSPEIWREDVERVFRRSWIYAGHVSRLPEPGSFFLHQVDTDSILVVRDYDGTVRAFHNVCRHRGARLCLEPDGHLTGPIRCPYHAWTYDRSGNLMAAPTMSEVEGFDKSRYPLLPVRCETWEGLLFLNLDSAAPALSDALAAVWTKFGRWQIPELAVVHRTVYEVDANWKLFFQNYSECYHCPGVHPHLNRLTPFRDSINDLDDGPILGGPMRLAQGPGGSMTMDGRACAAPVGEVGGEDLALVYYYTFFPNMFLSLHPDYVLVHRAEALEAGRTRIVCEWLFHPDASARSSFDPSGAVEFWDLTNRQDWDLCARTQLGVGSRAYVPGPYSDLESQLAAFDRHYLSVLGHARPERAAARG